MCNTEFHFYDRLQISEREDTFLEPKERLRAMEKPLLAWYGSRARVLPWREDPKPYRVWVSEIMLQQTRVEAVKPYFERFMDALPEIKDLAEAEDDRLMKLWEGLGYYSRVRNLKAAAVRVMEQYKGELPASYEELLSLPGIGSYTAGAIASIAYGIPVPAVDGNVLRVISRILADRSDIKKASVKTAVETLLKEVMPSDKASSYNQGLIETGALVCIPGKEPRCSQCPMESVCLTKRQGLWKEIPWKSPPKKRRIEERTVFIIENQGKAAIRKRPSTGLLASLYVLPNTEGHLTGEQVRAYLGVPEDAFERLEALEPSRHIFSHVEWHMTGYRAVLKRAWQDPDHTAFMVEKEEIRDRYPLPNAFSAYKDILFQKEDGT